MKNDDLGIRVSFARRVILQFNRPITCKSVGLPLNLLLAAFDWSEEGE